MDEYWSFFSWGITMEMKWPKQTWIIITLVMHCICDATILHGGNKPHENLKQTNQQNKKKERREEEAKIVCEKLLLIFTDIHNFV